MNILIVHAHPEKKSFSSALKDTAVQFFQGKGDSVSVSDLYELNFNPVLGAGDFKETNNKEYFKPQLEQLNAFNNGLFNEDIKVEMEKLDRADLVIFNFPLWWFSVPAILKGWVDRVFAMGFAYGGGKGIYENGVFKGKKKGLLCLTTGGPESSYKDDGFNGDINKILFHINHGMLYFVGMDVLPPFISYGPARLPDEEKEKIFDDYKKYLGNLESEKPLY